MKKVKFKTTLLALAMLATGFLLTATPARAETTNCTPITGQTVISTQGIYCLTGNVETNLASGIAIQIAVNNVTIDFNGYKLGNLSAGAGTAARGVYASGRKNVTIRNGIIRGFYRGMYLVNGSGYLVEDMIVDGNTYTGIYITSTTGVVVRNNRVVNTGGSATINHAIGLAITHCTGSMVDSNIVDKTTAVNTGWAFGLDVSYSDYIAAKGNRITNTSSISNSAVGIYAPYADHGVIEDNAVLGTSSTGDRIGIYIAGTNTQAEGNRISNVLTGIQCVYASSEIKDNSVTNATTPYTGCTDSGGNT